MTRSEDHTPFDFELPALTDSLGRSYAFDFEFATSVPGMTDGWDPRLLAEAVAERVEAGELTGTLFGPKGQTLGWYRARLLTDGEE